MSTKLSFRARTLDPSKPMPIYFADELPDIQEYSAINRAVPQMPSGMEKEEESEHHLQRAIIAGLIIPTPDVLDIKENGFYDKNYPSNSKLPRQMIHVQPLSLEQDIPDYDMDSGDELWLDSQSTKLDLSPYQFEQMIDRLEKITVCSLDDAKALVRRNEVNQDVFDYWVNKRLKTKHPLIFSVKTENRGNTTSNNPYIAFRRRTEKMQTRKNRKNDETSYEKMLKLRRDLTRALKLLELVKRREKMKRDELQFSVEIFEKRYQAKDFSGQLLNEFTTAATKQRPAFAPIYSNQYQHSSNLSQHNQWSSSQSYSNLHLNHHLQNNKRDFDGLSSSSSRKEKRQYKKRKHKTPREIKQIEPYDIMYSSDEEDLQGSQLAASESEDEGIYPFRRNKNCDYYKPFEFGFGDWPWESTGENSRPDPRYRYNLTSLRHPRPRCIGFARRRVGRGGRIILDRASTSYDEVWSRLDYTIFDSAVVSSNDERCAQINTVNEFVSHSDESKGIPSNLTSSTPSVFNNQKPGIVIKRENSISETFNESESVKVSESSVNDQNKLDDFEMLLDNASANSNIINKRLVCGSSTDLSDNKTTLKSTLEAQVHDESSSISKRTDSVDTEKTTSQTITEMADGDQDKNVHDLDNNHGFEAFADTPDDIYSEFIDEIKNEWLHFRPQTPPASPIDVIFDSDLTDSTKKFSIELQLLDKHDDMKSFTDNVYSSQLLSFNYSNNNLLISDAPKENVITIKKEPIDNDQAIEESASESDVIKKFVEWCKDDFNQSECDSPIDLNDFICEESEYPQFDKQIVGTSSFKVTDDPRKYKSSVPEDNNRIQNEQQHNVIKIEADSGDVKSNIVPIAELQTHNYVLQYGSPNNITPVTMHSTGYNLTNSSNTIETSLSLTPTNSQHPQYISSSNALISTPTHLQNKIVYDSNTIVLSAHPRRQVNGPSDRALNQSKFKQVYMLDLTQDKRKGAVDGVIKKNYSDLGLSTQNILVSSVNPNILTSNSSNSITQQGQGQQFSLVQNTLQKPIILSASGASSAGTILSQTTTGANTTKKIIVGATGTLSSYGNIVIPSSNSSIILDGGKIISTTNNQLQTQQKILTPQQRSKIENNVNLLKESAGDNNIIIAKGNNKSKIIQTANFISMQSTKNSGINVSPQNTAVKQITSSSIISNNKTIQRVQQSQFGSSSLNYQNTPTSSSSKMIIQQPNNGNNILGSVNNKDN